MQPNPAHQPAGYSGPNQVYRQDFPGDVRRILRRKMSERSADHSARDDKPQLTQAHDLGLALGSEVGKQNDLSN